MYQPWGAMGGQNTAELHFRTLSLLQPGPGNAQMTVFIYQVYTFLFPVSFHKEFERLKKN